MGRMIGVRMDLTAEVRLLRLLMVHCTPSLSRVEGCVVMPLHAWGDGVTGWVSSTARERGRPREDV